MALLTWGICGCGEIVEKSVAPAMAKDELSRIHGFYSHTKARAEELQQHFGGQHAYDTYADMLADEKINAIYVASPTYRHAEETIQALQAGKHVICEKPMALTVEDCKAMIAAAKANDVHLAVAYSRRFWPKTQMIRKLIRRGEIGTPLSARLRVGRYYKPEQNAWDAWRVEPDKSGGGQMQNVGSHRLDVMCYLLGKPEKATGMFDTLTMDYAVADTETIICKMQSGVHLLAEAAWNTPAMLDEFEIRGSEATLIATPFDAGQVVLLERRGEVEEIETPFFEGNRHSPVIEDFSVSVTEGRPPNFDGADGMQATAVLAAAYASAKNGRWESTS